MLADLPHHDGSATYTQRLADDAASTVRLWIRVPAAHRAERVRVRSVPDAEPLVVEAHVDDERTTGDAVTWWVGDLPLRNPLTNYRFLLEGGCVDYGWLNGSGFHRRDVPDAHDFRIATVGAPPPWLATTVGYQVFLDRFAASGATRDTPDWAVPAHWHDPVDPDTDISTRQLFGGDLAGIEQHLDHLEGLGTNLIYLTPFFPSRSSHRYDATSFDHVDPLLGGDDALSSLVAAAHERGIRVIGDITLNHTGDRHEWFARARDRPHAPESAFYMFGASTDDYVAWHDVSSLPKLDHRSEDLATRLYDGATSTIARFLRPPFDLDGWRIDCANTTGRHDDVDLTRHVAARTRATIDDGAAAASDRWLVAEHCYDVGNDLTGDGWHGSMAYQWFTRPLWSWLRGEQPFSLMSQIDLPSLDGEVTVQSMRELSANVPWSARQASMTMLDSHDSARFRTVVGGNRLDHLIGMTALATMPGVPTLFAGSEVGVEGDTMDTCRVPFPWDESSWDHETHRTVRELIELRRTEPALQTGGIRWIDAQPDAITFVRELTDGVLLVDLRRADVASRVLPIEAVTDRPVHRVDTRFELGSDRSTVGSDDGTASQVLRLAPHAGSSIIAIRTD